MRLSGSPRIGGCGRTPATLLVQDGLARLTRADALNVRGWREFQFVVPAKSANYQHTSTVKIDCLRLQVAFRALDAAARCEEERTGLC